MSAQHTIASETAAVRGFSRVATLPKPAPGFIGEGHTAVHVIGPEDFDHSDPFILLADDLLDLPTGRRAGGPHPHAGFEIVTFVVEGEMRDRDEGQLRTGDVAWMTAGSGVLHSEDVEPLGKVRILQLWVTSPSALRWVAPRFEHVSRGDAPVRREPGVEARVYSGVSGSVDAGSYLNLPLTMVDIRLSPNAVFDQALPASYNGFLYALEGELVDGGPVPQRLAAGQIGWLEHVDGASSTTLRLTAGSGGARVVLYAGERQGVPIVTRGPFVGETRADLVRVGQAYTQGRMPRLSELARRTNAARVRP
jgi:redox-sensitive bicupin YhaK (pirin superfamily)